ncbi:MAG: O-antigen ligase family protein [Patescibacteria group bacterium]
MSNFLQQFFSRTTAYVLLALLLTHVLAAVVQHTVWVWIPLGLIGLGTLALSYKRLDLGLAVAFLEIFIGGHGHLFDVDVAGFSVSVRQVIFGAVMLAWAAQVTFVKLKPQFIAHRDWPLAIIASAILLGTVIGFATNDVQAAFDDMNSYLLLAYVLPMISVTWTVERKRLLLQTLAVAAVWISLTTLLYLYGFTHLPGLLSHELYTFVRDARLAEVTLQTSGRGISLLGQQPWYFRVFQQSQAIALIFELVLVAGSLALWREAQEKLPKWLWALHVLGVATIIASLSRSFWLGGIAAFLLILGYLALTRFKVVMIVKRHVQFAVVLVISVVALWLLVAIPLPPRPDLSDSSFYRGPDDSSREVAVSSRWNLLGPMVLEIKQHPLLGSGFGETVTFISDDPRLRAVDPTGAVTAYRFEWGYHDVWLKMGILGLMGYLWFLVTTLTVTLEAVRNRDEQAWLMIGLTAGTLMLYVAHIFSPYLNHPIGLGYLIFTLPFLPWAQSPSSTATAHKTVHAAPFSLAKAKTSVAYKQTG